MPADRQRPQHAYFDRLTALRSTKSGRIHGNFHAVYHATLHVWPLRSNSTVMARVTPKLTIAIARTRPSTAGLVARKDNDNGYRRHNDKSKFDLAKIAVESRKTCELRHILSIHV